MMTYQLTPTYLVPTYAVCCNLQKIRFDSNYLSTKPGILKLLELIFIAIAFAPYSFCALVVHGIENPWKPNNEITVAITLGYNFYTYFFYILGALMNILFWCYLFHIVERYHTIPWYTIEYFVCIVNGSMSIIGGILSLRVCFLLNKHGMSIDVGFIVAVIFSFAAALVFIYNIVIIYKRKSMKIPPQDAEQVM